MEGSYVTLTKDDAVVEITELSLDTTETSRENKTAYLMFSYTDLDAGTYTVDFSNVSLKYVEYYTDAEPRTSTQTMKNGTEMSDNPVTFATKVPKKYVTTYKKLLRLHGVAKTVTVKSL